jgi:DNA-binding response OmpR family regulator
MLTARDDEADLLIGLGAGADDYIGKPFSPKELVARMKAVLRRAEPGSGEQLLTLGDVVVHRSGREVYVDGAQVNLRPKEFDLLAFLITNRGTVFSRELLLERVWGYDYAGGTRTVDVHVAQLRRKLGRPDLIRTVRGAGYKAVQP